LKQPINVQIVIIGGGIAGLWLLNRLRNQGYHAILLEKQQLGGSQTLASQGIVHGGLKYALNGVLTPASSAIADMPQRWLDCLAGTGELDLGNCRVLSPHYYMWSSDGYRARLKSFLGSRALHGRIEALDKTHQPVFFRAQNLPGTVYQLADFVLDVPVLIRTLAEAHHHCIFQAEDLRLTGTTSVTVGNTDIQAEKVILCAGEGNEALLGSLKAQTTGTSTPAMQRRPLHMVLVSHEYPHPLYAHCIGDDFGMTPRMTITTHPLPDGRQVWYLGGGIAETGVDRTQEEQTAFARRELQSLFPDLVLKNAQWQTLRINRAEPATDTGQRPDSAFVANVNGLMITWPSKFTLCPDLGDSVLKALEKDNISPPANAESELSVIAKLRLGFDFPGYALQPWDSQTMETFS